jgi:ubiquitin C-terminal hydrolase
MRVEGSGYSSVTHEHFTSLSLAITDSTSLAQCLQRHLACEDLTDFRIDGKVVPASLTKRFTYLPRILIIHLKRFDDTDKLDKFIDYSSELDLGAFSVVADHHYQLFGVCLHRGDMEQGHYVACCEVKGHWYYMDDDSVAKMTNINDIIQRDAYVLLYKRL